MVLPTAHRGAHAADSGRAGLPPRRLGLRGEGRRLSHRGPNAAPPPLAGFTRLARFHAQRARALERVRHGRLRRDPRERANTPPSEPLDKARCAGDLPNLAAAAEEGVQCFPRKVFVVRGHRGLSRTARIPSVRADAQTARRGCAAAPRGRDSQDRAPQSTPIAQAPA